MSDRQNKAGRKLIEAEFSSNAAETQGRAPRKLRSFLPKKIIRAFAKAAAFVTIPLAAMAQSPSQNIELNWCGSTPTYNVYASTVANGSCKNGAPLATVGANGWSGTPFLTSGITYYFTVTGVDSNGNESACTNEVNRTPESLPLTLNSRFISVSANGTETINDLDPNYNVIATHTFTSSPQWSILRSVEFTDNSLKSFWVDKNPSDTTHYQGAVIWTQGTNDAISNTSPWIGPYPAAIGTWSGTWTPVDFATPPNNANNNTYVLFALTSGPDAGLFSVVEYNSTGTPLAILGSPSGAGAAFGPFSYQSGSQTIPITPNKMLADTKGNLELFLTSTVGDVWIWNIPSSAWSKNLTNSNIASAISITYVAPIANYTPKDIAMVSDGSATYLTESSGTQNRTMKFSNIAGYAINTVNTPAPAITMDYDFTCNGAAQNIDYTNSGQVRLWSGNGGSSYVAGFFTPNLTYTNMLRFMVNSGDTRAMMAEAVAKGTMSEGQEFPKAPFVEIEPLTVSSRVAPPNYPENNNPVFTVIRPITRPKGPVKKPEQR